MIIEPKVREFICTTAHPEGCRENIKQQIAYVKAQNIKEGPKKVLVIGADIMTRFVDWNDRCFL